MRKIFYLFAVMLIINCGEESKNYTEEVIDGVKHIHNIKPKYVEPKFTLEFVRQFGELDSNDENYLFFRPINVEVDKDGNVYILDRGNYKIKKFTEEGLFVKSYGRKGQGPGEFQSPAQLLLSSENLLYVGDPSKFELMKFDLDLNHFGQLKSDAYLQPRHIFENGNILGAKESYVIKENQVINSVFSVFDKDGNTIKSFGNPKKYDDTIMKSRGNVVLLNVDSRKFIYALYFGQNRFEKYDEDGNLVIVSDRVLPFPESDKIEVVERKNGDGIIISRSISYNKFSQTNEVDSKNRIWSTIGKIQEDSDEFNNLSEDEKEHNNYFEVFDSNGVLLQNYNFEDLGNKRFKIIGERFFIIDVSEEMIVKEYRIVEN